MCRSSATSRLAAALVLAVLCAAPAAASINEYVENFSTKTYCDTLSTTALWDTSSGQLRLHPFQIKAVGDSTTPGFARNVVIAGDNAYIADDSSGLTVMDISDPGNPALAGNYNTSGYAAALELAGDYAYVADSAGGLKVIDISNPGSPFQAGSFSTGDVAIDVALHGDYALVADQGSGLMSIDISDPTSPSSGDSLAFSTVPRAVVISGNHAYVVTLTELVAVDISDPLSMAVAGQLSTPSGGYDIAVAGDYAFIADGNAGLQVVDITDPTTLTLAGSYDTPGTARGVAVDGDHAYVADFGDGLHVLDISDPTNPALVETYDTPGFAYGVAVEGEHAFVADYASGLVVLRVRTARVLTSVGDYAAIDDAYDVVIQGDNAFVTDQNARLYVIDINDPSSPALSASLWLANTVRGVAVAGDHAYVAQAAYPLRVIDVSDPTSPITVGSFDNDTSGNDVAVDGDLAYVAAHLAGLLAVDVSDPTNPALAGSLDTAGYASSVAIDGDHAYVADYHNGLLVIDVSDPTNPVQVGQYEIIGYARDVALSGDHAYIAYRDNGLHVVDISDPMNPVLTASLATSATADGVAVAGDFVHVSCDTSGVLVVDVSDPTNPVEVGGFETPGNAAGIAIDGDYAYVADGAHGLRVIEIFQRALNLEANSARSLAVSPVGKGVLNARFSATYTDSILWELSADGGANWEAVHPGDEWVEFSNSGGELLWRSTHMYADGHVNPTCTYLSIDMLYDCPIVASVGDIPNDQGRQVRVTWSRSASDAAGSATPVIEYSVFRRADDAGRPYEDALTGERYPPGSWDYVETIPAYAEDEYLVVVPTLGDSTISGGMHYSVFFIRAATAEPGVYFDSPPDSGYSVDNLAPAVPAGFAVDYSETENQLAWETSEDEDLQYFCIYRAIDPDFTPDPANLVHMTIDVAWTDSVSEGWQYHYKVSSVDFSGNESDAASPEIVTGIEGFLPGRFALYQNVPNPLSPTTVIWYDVPAGGGEVSLEVFDVSGRLVRRLLDGRSEAGRRSVVWDGKEASGASVASGVYYCRLTAPGYEKTLKMMVVK